MKYIKLSNVTEGQVIDWLMNTTQMAYIQKFGNWWIGRPSEHHDNEFWYLPTRHVLWFQDAKFTCLALLAFNAEEVNEY